jgi:alkylglycerol monooxygenase
MQRLFTLMIPSFVALMALEWASTRRRATPYYQTADTLGSFSSGVSFQIWSAFGSLVWLSGYQFLYDHARLATLGPRTPLAWVVLFLLVDLAQYLWHRASHRVNALWAVHIVHHHSEEYNLAVNFRQSWLGFLSNWPFYAPLVLAGFSPVAVLSVRTANMFYQYLLHTRSVGKLGILEAILNTPSHHRVHHATNAAYVDKNYGGVLILWDRLFGTFAEEREAPVYGTKPNVRSFNPLWNNVHRFRELWLMSKAAPSPGAALRVWWMPPEWRPAGSAHRPSSALLPPPEKCTADLPTSLFWYVFSQQVLAAAMMGYALFLLGHGSLRASLLVGALVVLSACSISGVLEQRSWSLPLERVRFVSLSLAAAWLVPNPLLAFGLVLIASASFAFTFRVTSAHPIHLRQIEQP